MSTEAGKVQTKIFRLVLRAIYLLAGAALLTTSLTLLDDAPLLEGPAQILLYGMMALSFPVGVGVVYLWGYWALSVQQTHPESSLGSVLAASSASGLATLWGLLLVLGYLQWFVVVPAAVRWWRGRQTPNKGEG